MNILSLGREEKKTCQKKEMEYSLLEKTCLSRSKHASKHWGAFCLSGCEHLNSAWAAEMSKGSWNGFTKRSGCYRFVEASFHYTALCFFSQACLFAVISGLWSICNDNLIMLALSKYVCYPFTQRSLHYACIEGWCPSNDAHWSNIC